MSMTDEAMVTPAMIEAFASWDCPFAPDPPLSKGQLGVARAAFFAGWHAARPSQPDAAMVDCQHPMKNEGPRIPLRWGSAATMVCTDCGAWRQTRIVPSQWQPAAELAKSFCNEEEAIPAPRTGEAAGDDLRETLRSMADELDGLIPYLASHHYDVTKLTGLIGKARGFEGRSRD
jgi:hypothetical protein